MLIPLHVDRLRVGMYIHSMECSWMSNPFWRNRFLIAKPADLASLRDAGIVNVVIDDSRGLGPTPETSPSETDTAFDAELDHQAPDSATSDRPAPRRPRTAAPSEVDRARATVERSRIAVTRMFGEARLGHAIQVDAVTPMVDEIAASVARDPSAMIKVTRLKTKNEYTYLHSVAVCALMINLARHLGLPDDRVRDIGLAGLLHDIGKMAMPEALLDKPGALTDQEFALIQRHPVEGHRMLIDSPDVDALVLDVCLHHHERIDGTGYPFAIAGDDISLHARMGAICDVYDAVTSNRPYKAAWSPSEALAKMLSWEGHFDPDILDAFIDSIGILPLGALVRLRSNRLGIVVGGNDDEPTQPLVRAFYAIPDQKFVCREDIASDEARARDPIVKTERGDYWFGDQWPAIRDAIRGGVTPPDAIAIPARPYVAVTVAPRFARLAGGAR